MRKKEELQGEKRAHVKPQEESLVVFVGEKGKAELFQGQRSAM